MDRFYDEQYVRLRNRELDKYYLHADDDGVGVSISQRRNSLNVAWRVHIYHAANGPYVLLHSAAYGRYLAATATPAPALYHGFRAELRDYDQPEVPEIMWLDIRAGLGRGVLLQNARDRYLRANGKYLRWNTGVTVENRDIEKVSTMMRWNVEPSALPDPIRARLPEDLSVVVFGQASDEGLYNEAGQGWATDHIRGRSLYYLRDKLARRVNQQPDGIAMCIPAGRYGRLTPLVVDLPRSGWGDISGTPAYAAPALYHGFRAVQRDYDHPVVPEIMWLDIRAGLGRGVLLQNGGDRYLRANGKYLRWNSGVTVESRDIENEKVSSMMRWIVEPIDLTERAPRIPDPIRGRLSVIVFGRQPGPWRGIRFPQADGIAMRVRAGCYGKPTPLVVDLPRRGPGESLLPEPSSGDHGSGKGNSPTAAVLAEPSRAGLESQQSLPLELLHNPSGSAGQSLTEHPDVLIEVARANLLVVESRCRSIRKELRQATDRLVHLEQQNIGALPKEERKVVIKEIRKLKEKTTKLEEAAALANEEFAKEQDKVTRAELRHGV